MTTWQLQDAKNRLSEVVKRAASEGPQKITVHGKDAAVVVSADDFRRMQAPKESLVAFFRRSPFVGAGLDLERRDDLGRPVDVRPDP